MIAEKIWPFPDLCLPSNPLAFTPKFMDDGRNIFTLEMRRFLKSIIVRILKLTTKRIHCLLTATTVRMWCIVDWTSTCNHSNGNRFCRWSKGKIGNWERSFRRRKANEMYKYYEWLSTKTIVDCLVVEILLVL
jgi:hypothetical protein